MSMNMQMPYLLIPGMSQMPNMCPYSNNNNNSSNNNNNGDCNCQANQRINDLEKKVNDLETRIRRVENQTAYSHYHNNSMQML